MEWDSSLAIFKYDHVPFEGEIIETFNQPAFIIIIALAPDCLLLGNVAQVSDVTHWLLVYACMMKYENKYCCFIKV